MNPTQAHAAALTRDTMKVGGRYNWKNQRERLIYMGRNWSGNGYWHQFSLVEKPDTVWCEVLDSDLSSFEESTSPAPSAAEPVAPGWTSQEIIEACDATGIDDRTFRRLMSALKVLDKRTRAPALPRPDDDALWDKTLKERDDYHEWADELAARIATITGVDIGEHSSTNCPWQNAIDAAEEFAVGAKSRFTSQEIVNACDAAGIDDRAFKRLMSVLKNQLVRAAPPAPQATAEPVAIPDEWRIRAVRWLRSLPSAALSYITEASFASDCEELAAILEAAPASPTLTEAETSASERGTQHAADYDMVDRFLRNNLDDVDYADFSAALDRLAAPASAPVAEPVAPMLDDEGRAMIANSHHYTVENIQAVIDDLKAVERGEEGVKWSDRDWRTQAGILARIIQGLFHDVPVAAATEPVAIVESIGGPKHLPQLLWYVGFPNIGAMVKPGDKLYTHPSPVAEEAKGAWKIVCGDWRDELVAIHGPHGHIVSGLTSEQAVALIAAHGSSEDATPSQGGGA